MSVRDRDRGWDDIKREVKRLRGKKVRVGVLSEAASATMGTDASANLAEYATYNEFGTKHIPERSFMRSTFDENRSEYERAVKRGVKTIGAGIFTAETLCNQLGVRMQADIEGKIQSHPPPPNAPSTIAQKGEGKGTLIDSSNLVTSISFDVEG